MSPVSRERLAESYKMAILIEYVPSNSKSISDIVRRERIVRTCLANSISACFRFGFRAPLSLNFALTLTNFTNL